MNERELRAVLGAEVELPPAVEAGLAQAYGQIRAQGRRAVRPRRGLRTALMLAAVAAALCAGAAALYFIARSEVPITDPAPAAEGMFGEQSRPSVTQQNAFDEYGRQILAVPNEERAPVDVLEAQAVVGPYLPEVGYAWQIGAYTITVQGYLLDEGTGTGKIYYTLERPGGVEVVTVFPGDGEISYNGAGAGVVLTSMFGRSCADLARTTQEKVCVSVSFAWWDPDGAPMRAEEGIRLEFWDMRDGKQERLAVMELPGLPSLPSTPVRNEKGEEVLRFSAVGMLLHTDDMDEVDYVALEYADGTRYVVSDNGNNIRNTGYELGTGSRPEMELMLCFNRLVDPARVSAVVVDGTVYPVSTE